MARRRHARTIHSPAVSSIRRSRGRQINWVTAAQLSFPLFLLLSWQAAGMIAGDFYIATPVQAVEALGDGVSRGWFFDSLGATLTAVGVGFAIAAVAGLWIGVTLGLVRFWGKVFEPIVLSTYSAPKVTLFPVFLVAFGFGLSSKIAFGMFHGIFPIIIMAMNATRSVSQVHLKVARSLRLSRLQTFRQVIFPSILPSLLTGLRLGFSVTLLGVILGEMFASRSGFGYVLVQAITLHDLPRMYGIIAVLILIAFVVNALFLRWEHVATHTASGKRTSFLGVRRGEPKRPEPDAAAAREHAVERAGAPPR